MLNFCFKLDTFEHIGSYSEDDNDDAGGGFFGGSDSEGEEHIQDHLEDRAALSPARETRSVVPEDEVFDEDEEAEESEQIWGKLDPHNDLQLPRYVLNYSRLSA